MDQSSGIGCLGQMSVTETDTATDVSPVAGGDALASRERRQRR